MTFQVVEVDGNQAIATLTRLRSEYPRSGDYPFLIGDADELLRIREGEEFEKRPFEQIVADSHEVDIERWIALHREEAIENGCDPSGGKWPGNIRQKGEIAAHRDILTRKIKPRVYVGLARIDNPWELPAAIPYGGWNECPVPEVHCAIFRFWQRKYGAQIVSMSGDVIECAVDHPSLVKEDAIDLAWQQYVYCQDIVGRP
jgi:hypothetical protein